MRLYYVRSTDVCSGAYAPGAGNPGFSKIIEGPSGLGYALRRRPVCMCHRSADSRRQAYTPRTGCSGRAAPIRAGICAGRVVFFHWCGVAKCSDAAANTGWLGRNEGIVGQPGDVAPRFRTGALPALPSMMAGRAPATGARRYVPRSSSTDFGAGSIDFSAAASRPGACERLRPRPLPPDSRPLRWRPAPGSGRFPARSRPVS